MAKTPKEIRQIASDMAERNKKLHEMQVKYEAMGRIEYKLPSPLNELAWIRPIIDTSPYDAKRGVKRALANLMLNVNIHPISVLSAIEDDDESKAAKLKANEWETILKWIIGKTARRKSAFYDSVIDSAATYHEIVGQIIHVPTQFKLMGASKSRELAALRYGDWAIKLVNPQTVDVDYSDYMPERVFSQNKKTAREIVDFWGDKVPDLKRKIKDNPDYAKTLLIEADYVDYDERMVWILEQNSDIASDEGTIVLEPEPWLTIKTGDNRGSPVPFLNWVAVAGGTDIDIAPEFQRQPLFFPVVQAEQWANTNIMATIAMSQALAKANEPEYAIISPRGEEGPTPDYDDPSAVLRMFPGETFTKIQKQGLDPALMESVDRYRDAIKRATVADILVTGQPMGGVEAFAAYNLQVQVAIASLGDIKHLGERFYESVVESMLLLSHYSGTEISGYGDDLEKYIIDSEDIDPKSIHLNVELKTDVPADRQQRVVTAATMARDLKVPTRTILEWLGESDPEGLIREWEKEQLDRAYMAGVLQKVQMMGSGELQQLMMQAQQGQELAQQVMQQQEQMYSQRGVPGVGGQEYNPAEGGSPPAMAMPSATRELQTGVDRYGNVVAQPGEI